MNYGDGEVLTAADFEIPVRSLRLWVLPEGNTTVMTGEGLGPDLTLPAPYVLARRRAVGTRFVTLLEPYDARPPANQPASIQDCTAMSALASNCRSRFPAS